MNMMSTLNVLLENVQLSVRLAEKLDRDEAVPETSDILSAARRLASMVEIYKIRKSENL